jgi:hypothetical protein
VIARLAQPGRFVLIVVMMAAWFAITNHCVLGAMIALGAKAPTAQMHCHGSSPAPAQNGDEQTPCCKVLKAVTIAKISAASNTVDFVLNDYPAYQLGTAVFHGQMHTLGLDTGPPDALSFSESVLQRSILAHAPPLSLS